MLTHFDGEQCPRHEVDIRTAVGNRNVEAIQTHGLGMFNEASLVGGLQFICIRIQIQLERNDLLMHKLAHEINQLLLFRTEREIHRQDH